MGNKNYWEDENYKIAIKEYSEYSQRCYSLNEFNTKDIWAFQKRNEWAKKVDEIKRSFK